MLETLRRLPRSLYVLYAGTTITRLGTFVFPYLTIYLSEARGYGVDRVGLILSVGAIGLLVGNFAGGWLADLWSRKRTLVVALVLNAAGFAGLAGHYDSGGMYAAFLLLGYIGSGLYTPAANAVIADLAPPDIRPFAYTVNYVCINLGMALGPLAAGFLAGISYSWIFVGDVATSLVCAALIIVGLPDIRVARNMRRRSEPGLPIAVWMRYPLVALFCLANFFMIGPLMGLEYSVPLLVKKVFQQDLSVVGAVYTVNALCILAFSFVVERLVRGRDEVLAMVIAGLFWTAGLSILLAGWSSWALLICTAVWTIGEIIGSILVPSFIARHVGPDVKGRFMALNDLVRSFAGVICPIGLGLVWSRQGSPVVVSILLAMPVVGILCYLSLGLALWTRGRATVATSMVTDPS